MTTQTGSLFTHVSLPGMNPLTVNLTLTSIELVRQRWERHLYIVVAVANGETPGQLTVLQLPDTGSPTLGKHWTQYGFDPPGEARDNLLLFSTPIPPSRVLHVRMWVMASMDGRRELPDILSESTGQISQSSEKHRLFRTSGRCRPFVIEGFKTADEGLDKLGVALIQSGDRHLGFVLMDQSFDAVNLPIPCSQTMLSGEGTVSWRWAAGAETPLPMATHAYRTGSLFNAFYR